MHVCVHAHTHTLSFLYPFFSSLKLKRAFKKMLIREQSEYVFRLFSLYCGSDLNF